MCAGAGTSVSSRFSANFSAHSRRSRNPFPDAPRTVCCSLVVARAVERATAKAWRRREGERGMMYFLSFLALSEKFKSKKLTFECFCAVFQCFHVFEPVFSF